jgi:hypothetical protein
MLFDSAKKGMNNGERMIRMQTIEGGKLPRLLPNTTDIKDTIEQGWSGQTGGWEGTAEESQPACRVRMKQPPVPVKNLFAVYRPLYRAGGHFGIALPLASRFGATGYVSAYPAAEDVEGENQAKNRRVVIKLERIKRPDIDAPVAGYSKTTDAGAKE